MNESLAAPPDDEAEHYADDEQAGRDPAQLGKVHGHAHGDDHEQPPISFDGLTVAGAGSGVSWIRGAGSG